MDSYAQVVCEIVGLMIEWPPPIPNPSGGYDPHVRPDVPRDTDRTTQETYEAEARKTIANIDSRNRIIVGAASVSRRWRRAVASCTSLWTNIAFETGKRYAVEHAKLILKNSKGASLTVHILDSTGNSPTEPEVWRVVEAIAAQSKRITLCVLFSHTHTFWCHWTYPAPHAHTLVIGGSMVKNTPLFGMDLGGLKKFVSFCYPLLPPSGLQNLTFLKMDNDGRKVSLTSLLDMLRHTVNLEKLSLGQFRWPGLIHDAFATPISLPKIKRLTLTSCDSSILLHHIHVSPSASLHIHGHPATNSIMSALPGSLGDREVLRGFTKLSVISTPQLFGISATNEAGRSVYIEGQDATRRAQPILLDVVLQFPHFSAIRRLYFTWYQELQGWPEQILNLPYLEELNIWHAQPNLLLAAINKTDFPALQVLKHC